MGKKLYTTSEYLEALVLQADGNLYRREDFQIFQNPEAADYDADWFVDYHKRQGEKRRKPVVYRIKLEKVSSKACEGEKK